VQLFASILEQIKEIKDFTLFIQSLTEIIRKIYNLRSAFVFEILKFFKEIILHLKRLNVDQNLLIEKIVLSEELIRCLCSANKVIFI
jgi:hypothetical protein